MKTRDDAIALLFEYTKNEGLRKHALAVEAAMRAYARRFGEDEEKWGLVGLLHDFDYERFPTEDQHPFEGARILREQGWPEEIVEGVLAHADYTGVPRDTPMKRAIFAVDELAGFIIAVALVHGKNLHNVDAAKVRKKLKDKAFARSVRREDIQKGFQVMGIDPDEHIENVIQALREIAPALGLDGSAS